MAKNILAAAFATDWGGVEIAWDNEGLCRLELPDPALNVPAYKLPKFAQTVADQVIAYLAGDSKAFDLPLNLNGIKGFRLDVYNKLLTIPYGTVISYGELAGLAGSPRAARAAGTAMAVNPLPLIIACHRVIGSTGHLQGFGGSLDLKQRLLELEGVEVNKNRKVDWNHFRYS